jgi:hypothetical protein
VLAINFIPIFLQGVRNNLLGADFSVLELKHWSAVFMPPVYEKILEVYPRIIKDETLFRALGRKNFLKIDCFY